MAAASGGHIQFFKVLTIAIVAVSAHPAVLSIAHRGGISAAHPENTLMAFRHAIAVGADVIEIDLRATSDGEIVILHDERVDRTTNGTGKVTGYTLAELKKLDAGRNQRIPTYREVLELIAGTKTKLLLDIKVSPQLNKREVIRLTEQHGAVRNVIAGVRTLTGLREFRRHRPEIRTLGFVASPGEIEDFVSAGADIIRIWPRWTTADPEIVRRVHEMGKPVWATAGDAPRDELEQWIRMGVDGILTDHPGTLVRLIKERSQP